MKVQTRKWFDTMLSPGQRAYVDAMPKEKEENLLILASHGSGIAKAELAAASLPLIREIGAQYESKYGMHPDDAYDFIYDQFFMIAARESVQTHDHRYYSVAAFHAKQALDRKIGDWPVSEEDSRDVCLAASKGFNRCRLQVADRSLSRGDTFFPIGRFNDDPMNIEFVEVVRKAMRFMDETFTSTERFILKSKYGLDGHPKKTLEELATILEVSRETVRGWQIKKERELRKLLQNEMAV